jgi:hypothetical protein
MNIQIKTTRELYRSVTIEYELLINGTNHIFRIYQNSQEGDMYWFDEEAFGSIEDYVLPGVTIEDILSWL